MIVLILIKVIALYELYQSNGHKDEEKKEFAGDDYVQFAI
jgi:hypothetical protein